MNNLKMIMSRYTSKLFKIVNCFLIIILICGYIQYNSEKHNLIPPRSDRIYIEHLDHPVKRYNLRVIVIVFDRASSLLRLLNSLNDAEYDNDAIKLEVWIDRSVEGNVDNFTLNTARNFTFKHGEYEVIIHPQHVGILGQWLTTWRPDVNSSEIAVFLEDDLTVSKYFWKYLKNVHTKYDNMSEVNGYTLQGSSKTFSVKQPQTRLHGPKNSSVFLFSVLGTWGFSPSTKNWKNFQTWIAKQNMSMTKPYVPDNIATEWYKSLSRQGKGYTMWEMWHIYYAWKNNEFTLYFNFPDGEGLATNWREKGLHYAKAGGSTNKLVTEWRKEYDNLSNHVPLLDLAGKVVNYKSVN